MKGTVYCNNGYWWYAVRLPGEKRRKARKLCAPGSEVALHADRARDVAIAAARKIWEDATRKRPTIAPSISERVDTICGAWLAYCETYYRHADGTPTSEPAVCRHAVRELRDLYGARPVAELQHSDMLAVRDALIRRGLCRFTINAYLNRVKRMWGWALDEGYITATHKAELSQAKHLKAYRSQAHEPEPIKPISDEAVESTIAMLAQNCADMVRVQRLTGMRPNEICQMAWADIDTSRTPWVYRPPQHKTQWRGHVRAVLIGPKARAILEKYRDFGNPFSPLAAVQTEMESPTKRKLGFSGGKAVRWTTEKYGDTIRYAAKNAGVSAWTPNQLRHAFATATRRKYGLMITAALMGHHQAFATTQGYSNEAAVDELVRMGRDAIEDLG